MPGAERCETFINGKQCVLRWLHEGLAHETFGEIAASKEAERADDGYETLREVLARAVEQAARGKGAERHAAKGEPFAEQQIVKFGLWSGNIGFQVGQGAKKALEAQRLPKEKAVAELLGAINYLAAAVIVLERTP